MKERSALGALCAAASLICAAAIQAQVITCTVGQFDANAAGYFSDQHWGTAVPTIAWDGGQNAMTTLAAANIPGSGSSRWVIPWTITGDQIMVTHTFGTTLNLNQYTNISYDIRFDSSSGTDGLGKYGALEVDWIPMADGWPSTPNPGQAYAAFASGNTNWIHVSMPLNASSVGKLAAVTGIGFKMQQNKTGANLSGTTRFWIDNIILSGFFTPPANGPGAPVLSQPVATPAGNFQLTLTTTNTARRVISQIEESSDVQTWAPILTVTNLDNSVLVSLGQAASGHAFFRAVALSNVPPISPSALSLWGNCSPIPYVTNSTGICVPVGGTACIVNFLGAQERFCQAATGFEFYGSFTGGINAPSSAEEMAVFVADDVVNWTGHEMGFVKTLNDNALKAYLQGNGRYLYFVISTGDNGYHSFRAQCRSPSQSDTVDYYVDGAKVGTLTNPGGSYWGNCFYFVGTTHRNYSGWSSAGQQIEMYRMTVF